MPVRRFRDAADIPAPARLTSALEGLTAACAASELSAAFGAARIGPRGVRRFRSVEEADEHRRRWTAAQAG